MRQKTYIPNRYFSQSLSSFKDNWFVQYIYYRFGPVSPLSGLYGVGTSFTLDGSTIFWQRDYKGILRGANIYLFDPITGKQIKRIPLDSISFINPIFKDKAFDSQNCFFLEHLIKWDGKPVVITLSEKRAVVANIRQKDFVFVAAGDVNKLVISGGISRVLKHFRAKKFLYESDMESLPEWGQVLKEFPALTPYKT